jgi:hypothetical protein
MAALEDQDWDYESCKMTREDELVILEVSSKAELLLYLTDR